MAITISSCPSSTLLLLVGGAESIGSSAGRPRDGSSHVIGVGLPLVLSLTLVLALLLLLLLLDVVSGGSSGLCGVGSLNGTLSGSVAGVGLPGSVAGVAAGGVIARSSSGSS